MNVVEIDAASNNRVDDIRQVIDEVQYSPAEGRFKVYIIDEVHMLSTSAFNALLKTLEEPPAHAIFILATTEVHKIPITILSRCQHYDFKRISIETITARMQELMDTEQIEVEVNTCADKIKAVTGTRPTLFRCPYGEYNDTVVSTINGLGMHVIQWDVDSLDWKGLSGDEITTRVLTRVQPGSIVLFHNAAEHTPEALAGIIEALIADGYTILPVSQMLLPGDTHIDPNGRQCPADTDAGT